MLGLFKRAPKHPAAPVGVLGVDTLATRLESAQVPAGCIGIAFGKGGVTSRLAAGARLPSGAEGWCFHPGPYDIDFPPFLAAPELGLHISFAVDAPDPRVGQQRFDLFLASEASGALTLAAFSGLVAGNVQRELAQGNLELPPCTSPDEWNAFRAGLNRVLYQRFGVTVEDCLPVDLGDRVDYADMLRARAAAPALPEAGAAVPAALNPARADALALRRLFLELPALGSALRQVHLPEGQGLFRRHQELLQRLEYVALAIDTMPALDLLGPGRKLDPAGQAARAHHSEGAALALDEAWSLLARIDSAPAALIDETDRVVANLELHCAARRQAP